RRRRPPQFNKHIAQLRITGLVEQQKAVVNRNRSHRGAAVLCSVALADFLDDRVRFPRRSRQKLVPSLVRHERLLDLARPGGTVLGLHISQHSTFAVPLSILLAQEAAKAVFAEVLPDGISVTQSLALEMEDWVSSPGQNDLNVHTRAPGTFPTRVTHRPIVGGVVA